MAKWTKVRDRKSNGKKTGVVLKNNSTGDEIVLLNPHGKYKKYQAEINKGVKLTNEGKIKRDKQGQPIALTQADIKYRQGYSSALIDQTKIFNGGKK